MSLNKFIALSLAAATAAYAAAYKIPEQSLNGTALGAAYIANAHGADASYYNPANMVFSSDDNELELGLSYVSASEIDFETSGPYTPYSSSSEKENVVIPTLHYIIPSSIKNTKFGVSLVAPAGLSKRWNAPFAKTYAEEFTLKIVELNPTIGYKINDKLAIGGGLRFVYTKGIVKNQGAAKIGSKYVPMKRDLEADSFDYGYNLALTYKPLKNTVLAMTYRSFVDIEVNGTGTLFYKHPSFPSAYKYDGDASIKFPLPASLNIAIAQTFGDLTAEFVYERTYWSEYKVIDFNYNKDLSTPLDTNLAYSLFDKPRDKNWKDTNSYKLGLTYKANKDLTLMGSYGIDESPAPTDTLAFELPDADAKVYSLGFDYKLNKTSSFGMAYLISVKDDRKVEIETGTGNPKVPGEFKNSSVSLLTLGYTHKF
ncbi:MAG: porin [Campylobacteraceae bacterium]|nr:porin [Campylobacteraceae bacterium]